MAMTEALCSRDSSRLRLLPLHVSSDTEFHALWRHPDLRTPGLVEDQLRAVPSVASRSLSR